MAEAERCGAQTPVATVTQSHVTESRTGGSARGAVQLGHCGGAAQTPISESRARGAVQLGGVPLRVRIPSFGRRKGTPK